MAELSLININAWRNKIESDKRKIKSKATDYVQKKAKEVLMEALRVSPQWSGNYAANWVIETNQTGSSTKTNKFKVTPWQALIGAEKQAGDTAAINWNYTYINKEVIENLRWNTKIRLTNHADIHPEMEAGTVKLRPVNLIPNGPGVIAHLKAEFPYLR